MTVRILRWRRRRSLQTSSEQVGVWSLRATSCARAAGPVQGSEKAKCGRGGGQVSDKMRGDEVRSFAANCQKQGVQNINFWTDRHWVSTTDFSIGTLAVYGHTEKHFEVSYLRSPGTRKRIREEEQMGITPLSP
jgi:hypothetical protein